MSTWFPTLPGEQARGVHVFLEKGLMVAEARSSLFTPQIAYVSFNGPLPWSSDCSGELTDLGLGVPAVEGQAVFFCHHSVHVANTFCAVSPFALFQITDKQICLTIPVKDLVT